MKKTTFSTAQDCEAAFYEALEACDLEAMMEVWAEDEEVVCITNEAGQTEEGKWRVEFDEPWAKEGGKPPEPAEAAAEAIGAVGMGVLLAHLPPMRRAGRTLLWAVAGFGAAALFWAVFQPWWSFPWSTLDFATAFTPGGPPLPSWFYVGYLIVLGTVVPFALAVASMKHISASQASVMGMSEPVIASAIAWVILGEVLAPIQVIGGFIVLVGILLAERSR